MTSKLNAIQQAKAEIEDIYYRFRGNKPLSEDEIERLTTYMQSICLLLEPLGYVYAGALNYSKSAIETLKKMKEHP